MPPYLPIFHSRLFFAQDRLFCFHSSPICLACPVRIPLRRRIPRPSKALMIVDTPELSYLETFSPGSLHTVINLLPLSAIKDLSCASKRLRDACLPTLFRQVKFEFSEAGLGELSSILKSDVHCHVVSFTYAVPDLFVQGKCPYINQVCTNGNRIGIQDFNRFTTDILTPGCYVEEAKFWYDEGYGPDGCPPYMAIYETVHRTCEEQRIIIDT